MAAAQGAGFSNRYLSGWPLFWLIATPMCGLMIFEMLRTDLSTGQGVSHMIGYSVRFSVPFIFLVTGATASHTLFPGAATRWLARNRKYLGLCFAVAMAWQGTFIYMMSGIHTDYYYEEVFFFRDELEGSTGYIFLTAMVLTSFSIGRRWLDNRQWTLLHRSGVYFLWAYPFSVYWWAHTYYPNPQPYDYFFYWAGFIAFAMRIAAWGKKRQRAMPDGLATPIGFQLAGYAIVAAGLIASATGLRWQAAASGFLTGPSWSATLELWLPFWPFEPFLPLFAIGIGTWLVTMGARQDLAPAATSP